MEDITYEDTDIDTRWIKEFEQEDALYNDFYKVNNESISVSFIYINNSNEIIYINRENVLLEQPNILSKEQLIYLLKSHKRIYNKSFKLLSLLRYNYDHETTAVLDSIRNNESIDTELTSCHYINDIVWNKTISIMADLNELFVVFYHDLNNLVKPNTTRKIRLVTQSSNKKTRTKRT